MHLTSGSAANVPYVLIVAPQNTNTDGTRLRQLEKISQGGREKIADISHYSTLFGVDDSTLALVNTFTNEIRLLVIDRKSLKIISNLEIYGVTPSQRQQTVESLVAIQSKNFSVYFPTFDPEQRFGFAEVNWKTGMVRQFPKTSLKGIGDIVHLVSLPSGFAVSGFGNTVALFDTDTQKQVSLMQEKGDDYSWASRRMYFVPSVGLMEYYNGQHLQLTDTNLLPVTEGAKRFPSPEIQSKIFVRSIQGKLFLIWGENTRPKDPQSVTTTITEIVIFDLDSKKEILRKPLGGSFSEYIQPNQDGTRIYFIEQKTGEIFYLDRESQTISSFAKTGVKADVHSYAVMVDAN